MMGVSVAILPPPPTRLPHRAGPGGLGTTEEGGGGGEGEAGDQYIIQGISMERLP